jgi:RHS repeat-associated protein
MGNKLLAEYQPVTATKYYYASDQINSTRIITDSSGTVVYSALFDPYGGLQKQWVNTYSPSLKFSGKERESKSEMDYFGARYYDHLKYRFISLDPVINKDEALVNPQLWNLYSYCRNNPVTLFDPDGREVRTNDQMLRLAIALAGATNTGGPIVNSAIQSPNVLNIENASLETGNTGGLEEGSWVTEGGNFITGNIVEITAQIDITQTQSYGRPIVATAAHEMMHGNTVITNSGKGIDAWRAALRQDNLPDTNIKATPTVNGVAGRFGTAVAAEVASGLLTGNTDFLMRAASIFSQIGGN